MEKVMDDKIKGIYKNSGVDINELLGQGGFGEVYKCKMQSAIKHIPLKNKEYEDAFFRELKTMSEINHPNVVRLYKAEKIKDESFGYIIMEYVEGKNLAEVISNCLPTKILEGNQGNSKHQEQSTQTDTPPQINTVEGLYFPFGNSKLLQYLLQATTGLIAIHKKGIIHRDIKPNNIIINYSKDELKIADFGLAKRIEAEHLDLSFYSICGTAQYMAPEQMEYNFRMQEKQLIAATDIYSLGATFYSVITQKCIFDEYIAKYANDFNQAISIDPELASYSLLDESFQKATKYIWIAKKAIAKEKNLMVDLARELDKRVFIDNQSNVENLNTEIQRILIQMLQPNKQDRYLNAECLFYDLRKVAKKLQLKLDEIDRNFFLAKNG